MFVFTIVSVQVVLEMLKNILYQRCININSTEFPALIMKILYASATLIPPNDLSLWGS